MHGSVSVVGCYGFFFFAIKEQIIATWYKPVVNPLVYEW